MQTIVIADPETDFLEWAVNQLATPLTRVHIATRSDDAYKLYCAEDADLLAAGRGIDADDLLITAEFVQRYGEGHEVKVVAALAVLAGAAELEEVEHGLDVRVEAVIALAGEGDVAAVQRGDHRRFLPHHPKLEPW